MLKERFLTTVAVGAIAALALNFAPSPVDAQQRILTQPERSDGTAAPDADGQAQEGAGETETMQDQQAQEESAEPLENQQAQDDAAEPLDEQQVEQDTGVAKETDRLAGSSLFVGEQDATEVVASNLIGKTIYNSQGESLGDVNDLVIAENGTVTAVIIGVGGLLGIGEKDVAVSYDAVTRSRQPDSGEEMLIVDASSAELEAAPEFETLAMKLSREEAERAAAQAEQQEPAPGAGAPQPLEQPAQRSD